MFKDEKMKGEMRRKHKAREATFKNTRGKKGVLKTSITVYWMDYVAVLLSIIVLLFSIFLFQS